MIIPFGFLKSSSIPISIYPTGDAASIAGDEGNSVAIWTSYSGSTVAVNTTDKNSTIGSVGIVTTTPFTTGWRGTIITVENGADYDVTFDYKVSTYTSGTQRLGLWTGVTATPTNVFNTDGAWHTLTVSVTTTATSMLMKFYAAYTDGTASNTILIDNISIIKTS